MRTLIALMLLAAGAGCTQRAENPMPRPTKPQKPAALAPAFPESWFGKWRGDAEVRWPAPSNAANAKVMRLVMELHIGPKLPRDASTSQPQDTAPRRWKWTIVYDGAEGRQERKYELVERDANQGLYAIDEKNTIVLPVTLIGDALVSPFEIQGKMLVCTYRFDAAGAGPDDDTITVEIVVMPMDSEETSGDQGGVPEVKGYAASSIQRAVMKRRR
ncbi:MAG: hypothetical protein ACKVZJ_05875 [Phycisphaerales bacterium]